jgi:hypothetical protein
LARIVEDLLAAKPARLAIALQLAAECDALGDSAARGQVRLHGDLRTYAENVADTAMMRREVLHLLDMDRTYAPAMMTAYERSTVPIGEYLLEQDLAHVTLIEHGPDSAMALVRTQQFPNPMIGTVAPRVVVPFSFYGTSTTVPAPNQYTLIVFISGMTCKQPCFAMSATLQRVHQRFPNVAIVTVTQTQGWFRNHPPMSTQENARLLADYYKNFLHLPGTIMVDTTPYMMLPKPDGRRVNGNSAAYHTYSLSGLSSEIGSAPAFLVNQDGKIVFSYQVDDKSEKLLTAMIQSTVMQSDTRQ